MAQVILHSMHKLKGKKGFFTIKVDLAKAYDMISLSFVDKVLVEIGIPTKLCGLIMGAITVVKMRVLWNEDKGD